MASRFVESVRYTSIEKIAYQFSPKDTYQTFQALIVEIDELEEYKRKYQELLDDSVKHAQESSALLLKAALAGGELVRRENLQSAINSGRKDV